MDQPNPVDLLAGSVEELRPVLAAVQSDHLTLQTPCAEWDLRSLLGHLAGRAELATRAANRIATPEFVDTAPLGEKAAAELQSVLDSAVAAWRRPDADPSAICVTPLGELPGMALVTFLAQDAFVHAWDIAKTIGVAFAPDERLTDAMVGMHHQTITDDLRAMFFVPEVPVPATASPLDQLVGFLGRQP